MTQKYFLIDCLSEVNQIIHQPLQQTQRIKFISFDLSANYIVFGATSGGIYIFNRNPCQFLKLVPSKEGSIVLIAISNDEKFIAIATSRGLIVLVENCFNDLNIRYQLYSEHRGFIITAIKWNFHEIYCGDNFGKVSVISLANILSKAIFQTASTILMQLDSSIIQLDVYSKFLLVSTKTKTFLCDTEEEQYRQIGKKLRDGQFGACFNPKITPTVTQFRERQKSIFKILKEGETFTNHSIDNVKIFCTRPGLRIWEANFEASVICTHQFKNNLNDACTDIIKIKDNLINFNNTKEPKKIINPDTYNFGKIIFVQNKFLITFNNNIFLIFLAENLTLLYLSTHFKLIKDLKIDSNYIYIWGNNEVKILNLIDLEGLIIKTLAKKQYTITTQICLKFIQAILQNLENSQRLFLLSILKDKIKDAQALIQLDAIFNKIKDLECNKIASNGIIVVPNGFVTNEASCSAIETNQDHNYNLIMYRQYQLNQMYNNIETPKLYELLDSKELHEIVDLFKDFLIYLNDLKIVEANAEMWCFEQYLKCIAKHPNLINDLSLESIEFQYLLNSFKVLNLNANNSCICAFPLPCAKLMQINFEQIGLILYEKFSDKPKDLKDLCTSVPYMWKFIINNTKNDFNLPLLIQFGDLKLFDLYINKFTYDLSEDSIRLLIKLKTKHCLNCEKIVDTHKSMHWKDFGIFLIKAIGGANTIKLFLRYAKFIPNSDLGVEFYQSCIFTTVIKHEKSINFMRNMYATNNSKQFDKSLQKYLTNTGSCSNNKGFIGKFCSACDLAINVPILDECVKLDCGHFYHTLCVDNNICLLCTINVLK